MSGDGIQGELFKPTWQPSHHSFRLRVNDLIRIDGRLGRVIRVTECAAVVLVNRLPREFTTRFDKQVRFCLPPIIVRIAANSEIAILARAGLQHRKHRRHLERRAA